MSISVLSPAPFLSPAPLRWDPPAAIRGTVVILHGRGDHGGVYDRLGRHLAADGYAVAAPDLPDGEDAALASTRPGVPFVVIGSDTGAIRAIELASVLEHRPDALVLAGLPLGDETAGPVPSMLPDIPVLVLHGDGDPVSPVAAARALTATSPLASLAVVRGGLHEILNGATHRSVAAHVVLFLEALRAGHQQVVVEQS